MLETVTNTIVLRLEWVAQELDEWADAHLLNVLIILTGAWIVRRLSTQIISQLLKRIVRPSVYPTKSDRQKRIKTLRSLASGIIRVGVYIVTTILIVGEIKPGSTGLLFTSAGVLGVVIGFGAQSLIKDLVTGIFIIIENQFRIGDEVSLHAGMGLGTIEGTVEDVTIRTTVLRDLSGNVHHVPNGNIGLTTNKTLGYSRMNEVLVVPYETDLDKLEKIIKIVGQDLANVPELQHKVIEPPHMSSVRGFTEQGIAIRVLAKTSAASQWRLRSLFFRRLQKDLAKNKIKIVGHEDRNLGS
jgi:moderate conductance mechanosensitive channel